jgi:hypothetical protein
MAFGEVSTTLHPYARENTSKFDVI